MTLSTFFSELNWHLIFSRVSVPFSYKCVFSNQSCAGAPRCKQRGMFAPPLQIPLKEIITLNSLVWAEVNNRKMELINYIIINGYRGSFHPRSKLAGYSTEINQGISSCIAVCLNSELMLKYSYLLLYLAQLSYN